jgi:hypothetical protein
MVYYHKEPDNAAESVMNQETLKSIIDSSPDVPTTSKSSNLTQANKTAESCAPNVRPDSSSNLKRKNEESAKVAKESSSDFAGDVRVLTSEAMLGNQPSNGIPFESLPYLVKQELRASCNQINAESKPKKKLIYIISGRESQTSSKKCTVPDRSLPSKKMECSKDCSPKEPNATAEPVLNQETMKYTIIDCPPHSMQIMKKTDINCASNMSTDSDSSSRLKRKNEESAELASKVIKIDGSDVKLRHLEPSITNPIL